MPRPPKNPATPDGKKKSGKDKNVKGRCLFCGKELPRSEFGIDCGFDYPGEMNVCKECTEVFLETAASCRVPDVMMHFVNIVDAYENECQKNCPDLDGSHGDLLDFDEVFGDNPALRNLILHTPGLAKANATRIMAERHKAEEERKARENEQLLTMETLGTPREIYDFLGQYCYGQEEARKCLAVAVHNHYKRIIHEFENARDGAEAGKSSELDADPSHIELQKSNVLLVGPTGSGKTLLAQALAKKLKVPFAISDATALTEAGYVGEDVENILLRLVQAADYDLKRAEIGIVYVDEIDKIARHMQNVSITRDVSGEGVQQALLKIVENTVANIPPKGGRKHPDQEYLHLNTKNILFICGGAFVGLDKIVAQRGGSRMLGFGNESTPEGQSPESVDITEHPLDHIEPEDLIKFGLIPEFVGRLPVITTLKELSQDDLVHILTEPRNALTRQYEELMRLSGIQLVFTRDALEAVAARAVELHTGARGLRAIIEKRMLDVMFNISEIPKGKIAKCTVDGRVIRGEIPAVVELENA